MHIVTHSGVCLGGPSCSFVFLRVPSCSLDPLAVTCCVQAVSSVGKMRASDRVRVAVNHELATLVWPFVNGGPNTGLDVEGEWKEARAGWLEERGGSGMWDEEDEYGISAGTDSYQVLNLLRCAMCLNVSVCTWR